MLVEFYLKRKPIVKLMLCQSLRGKCHFWVFKPLEIYDFGCYGQTYCVLLAPDCPQD